MAKLNQAACVTLFGNTGMPTTCTFNPGLIIGALAMPTGTVLSPSDLADIQATIQDGLINDTYGSRFHLFGKFEGINFQNEDRQQQTYGYGRKVTTRPATYYWQFPWLDGALCKQIAYTRFNYREGEFEYLLIDDQRNMIGTLGYTATDLQGLRGLSVSEFYTENWNPKDGTNETQFMTNIGLADATQINQYVSMANLDFDIFALNQVQDVNLILTSADGEASSVGGFTLDVIAGCGNANLVELFPA